VTRAFNRLFSPLSALALLSVILLPSAATGTTMVKLQLAELCWIADIVAEAQVVSIEPELADNGVYIRTVASLQLTHVLKGSAIEGDQVMVREWGGRLDGEVTQMPSSPVYTPGERVLVFLEAETRGSLYRTVGMIQGKFTLIEEQDTGRDIVVRVAPSRTLTQFDEAAVQLPAIRRYGADLRALIRQDLDLGFVPAYRPIPGLPPAKDAALRAHWGVGSSE
tara:strand:+ start:570 stop:1235 length:666 start_codon:yes stop_codon:yes gene_type:complete